MTMGKGGSLSSLQQKKFFGVGAGVVVVWLLFQSFTAEGVAAFESNTESEGEIGSTSWKLHLRDASGGPLSFWHDVPWRPAESLGLTGM